MPLRCSAGNKQSEPSGKELRMSSPCTVVLKKESIPVKVFALPNQGLFSFYLCKILYFVTNF